MQDSKQTLLNDEMLVSKNYFIRGQKIMLDRDLAELYGVETKVLKQAVKRNLNRFPMDFMFELTKVELDNLRSQIVTSSWNGNTGSKSLILQIGTSGWGGTRYMPMVFTEQGIIMLSSVLNSKRAIEVNIRVVRIFIRLREMISTNKEILHKLEQLESRMDNAGQDIKTIFSVLRKLINSEEQASRKQIGYKTKNNGKN